MTHKIEIMDTTLRDGEQTTGVSFKAEEKLSVARVLIESLRVDRVEVASARVSSGEFEGVKRITSWAKENACLESIEVLGFVDGTLSIDWIREAGGKVINLLTKGSLKHLEGQLRKTPEQHIADIRESLKYANSKEVKVNIYLEDWSNGMLHSKEYVWHMLDALKGENIQRFMLPDTLGVLDYERTSAFFKETIERYPKLHFDFHAHNDYDLAVANVLAAVRAGAKGVHTTVNGLGERAGNAPLSSVIGVLADQHDYKFNIKEGAINRLSRTVETFSGVRIPQNKPVIGEYVFTQCSGVHADGDTKADLYANALTPERFGRKRVYALGKTSGKSNIKKNLEELGIELDEKSMKEVTRRVIELGDKKETVTIEDLPYIVADVLESGGKEQKIKICDYLLSMTSGMKPFASVQLEIKGDIYEEIAYGDGQYDAFTNAVGKVYKKLGKTPPQLIDYTVTIPPGGKTDALVETVILWNYDGREYKTRGLAPDQTEAAIKATHRMLNLIENL